MKTILCLDIGTTKIKAAVQSDSGLVLLKMDGYSPEENYLNLVRDYKPDCVFVTGSGERHLEGADDYIKLDELECTAYIVKYLGLQEGLVTNMGTGTSFTLFSEEGYRHLNGTGIGGGALIGLGERMLGTSDPDALEALAIQGDLSAVNIVIDDIYPQGLGWLAGDVTVANFGKEGGSKGDVALGIHSLVTESIVSMVRALLFHSPVKDIILCGGVTNNRVVTELFAKYSALFGFKTTYLEEPSFGTALGMLALVEDKYDDVVNN